jgi:hypothetical protein
MNGYDLLLFSRLLSAHFFADFLFLGESWRKEISDKRWKSSGLYLHSFISTGFIYLCSTLFNVIWFPVVIFISRVLFDSIKFGKIDEGKRILLKQLSKITTLVVCLIYFKNSGESYNVKFFLSPELSFKFWILALSYITIFWPAGFLIGQITEQWREQIKSESLEGLGKAGLWIGRLERILILTFVLINRFEAIGFLIAAKSIFRFGEITNSEDRKIAEYILIGTLLSVVVAIFFGMFTKWLLSIPSLTTSIF